VVSSRTVTRPGKPVLVVEDHDDTRAMVEMFLELDGYSVVSAAHGRQALDVIERERPCLILLDVMMPVMDGPACARMVRANTDPQIAATPIVLLTAVPNARQIQLEVGAVDVIAKPITFDTVAAAVERHCRVDG